MKRQPMDLTGQRFGRLTAVRISERRTGAGKLLWACRCDCGGESEVRIDSLRSGHIVGCGCVAREKLVQRITTHGKARTPEYRCWQQLRQRCSNPHAVSYGNYGGRGITVCERWRDSFENFLSDMGPRPSPAHSIDREKNDGPYSPDNCRWTVMSVQLRNRRTNNILTHDGRSMTVTDWAAELGISASAITARLKRGWTIEAALTTPADAGTRKRVAHQMIEFHGETLSQAEWTRRLGGRPTTLLCRLKAGWSIERALTTPVHH